MSENEKQWTKALAEEGSYDAEKARHASEAAVSLYSRGLKKTERILGIYLIACVAVAVFSADSFMLATSNKALIGYGIVFLVAVETTILMKLWYWIVNTRLTLQKEIRQWQVQATMPESTACAPAWLAEMSFGRHGLSPWERRAWLLGLVVVAIATGSYVSYSQAVTPTQLTLSESVKLTPDGTSSATMNVSYRPRGGLGVESFPLQTGCLKGTIRWLDEHGRQLPFEVSTDGGQRCYTVHLIEPIRMGEWLRYTQIRETPLSATRQRDLWTYKNELTYGCSKNRFFITVELPRGAKVVATEPQPAEQSTDDDIPRLVFSATRERNERFGYTIQYQLADTTSAQKPAP